MCPQADLWARLWAMGGSPTLPLALACVFCLPSPCPKATSRMEPWNRNVLLRLLDWVSDKTQSRLLHKLLRFRLIGTEFYSSWRWWNSSWAISKPKRWCCKSAALKMSANLENSAVATGLENVSSNPKERQCQRMLKLPHDCTHLTC